MACLQETRRADAAQAALADRLPSPGAALTDSLPVPGSPPTTEALSSGAKASAPTATVQAAPAACNAAARHVPCLPPADVVSARLSEASLQARLKFGTTLHRFALGRSVWFLERFGISVSKGSFEGRPTEAPQELAGGRCGGGQAAALPPIDLNHIH